MANPDFTPMDENDRFQSLEALRTAHNGLLKRFRAGGRTPEMTAEIVNFIRLGKATGALLDNDDDRWEAQGQLDYWATQIYQPGEDLPDTTLYEFNELLAPELDASLCPYMGLNAFHEANKSFFFGRRRLVDELIDKLRGPRFLAILGSSGSGKSSAVRAGLIPELKKDALPGSADWTYFAPMVPGSHPLRNLARLILSSTGKEAAEEKEAASYRNDPAYLVKVISACQSNSTVLVIDQFEEIFTLCTDELARQRFVENLISLCRMPEMEHRVIITMRSDFEPYILRLPDLYTLFEQNSVRILPLAPSELREVIEAPAAQIGLRFDPGVVDALLNDILGEPAALPLLQFTLLKLWENRERNRVTWETYKKLGGGRQALARSADEFYSCLIYENQMVMKRILLKMVKPGEGLEVTSNRVLRAELFIKSEDPERVTRVLDKLIKERLVSVSEGDVAANEQIEIAHEALVRNWPTLVKWLNEERANLRRRQGLTSAAEEWQRLNRSRSALWRGEKLKEALGYDDLNDLEKKFVKASSTTQKLSRAFMIVGVIALITSLAFATVIFRMQATENQQIANTAQAASTSDYEHRETAEAASTLAVAQQSTAESSAKDALHQADLAFAIGLSSQAQLIWGTQNSKQMTAVLLAVRSMQLSPSEEAAQVLQSNTLGLPKARVMHDGSVLSVAFDPEGAYVVSGGADGIVLVWWSSTGREKARMIHDGRVNSVVFSPDGKYIVSGSNDYTARVWKSTGEEVARMTHDDYVTCVSFSPDGKFVVSGSNDYTARVWDAATGNEIARVKHNGSLNSLAFSPNGTYVASGSSDNIALVWEAATGREVARMLHEGSVSSVAFSPDGKYIVTGSSDNTTRVWEISTKKTVSVINKFPQMVHDDIVNSVAYSPDGAYVVSGSSDNTARVWEVLTGRNITRVPHDDDVTMVVFSPDGKYVLSGSSDGTARVWETITGKEFARMTHEKGVRYVAFSPDKNYIVSGSEDGSAIAWMITTGNEIARVIHKDRVYSVNFSQSGNYMVSAGCDSRDVQRICTQAIVRVWKPTKGYEFSRMILNSFVRLAVFSPNEKYIVAGVCDERDVKGICIKGEARVWDPIKGREVAKMVHPSLVVAVAFSPDSQYVVSGGCDLYDKYNSCKQGSARVWVAATGEEVARMMHDDYVTSVAFSPDGRYVVSGDDDSTAKVWVAITGKEMGHVKHDGGVNSLSFSPDSKYVVSGSYDGTERVWVAATGEEVARMMHDDYVTSVAFSPDGKYVISGSYDYTARVWEPLTGKEISRMTHNDRVNSVAFSPDGRYVVSGSNDGTARVWEILTGEEVARMTHEGIVYYVTFSQDGSYVASGSGDGTARVWIWQNDKYIESACSHLPRNFTLSEWAKYFPKKSYEPVCKNLPAHATVLVDEVLPLVLNNGIRVSDAIHQVNEKLKIPDGVDHTDQAQLIVKHAVEEQLLEISKSDMTDEVENRYFSLIKAANDGGLRIQVDSNVVEKIVQELLQNPNDPNRVQASIIKAKDLLMKGPVGQNYDNQARRIIEDTIGSMILDPGMEVDEIIHLVVDADQSELKIETTITDTSRLYEICWIGSIQGYAQQVLVYCEQAVALQPDNSSYRDSRGLARALTGDIANAIDDFKFYIENLPNSEHVAKRKEWIKALQTGENPFTQEVLEALMTE